LHGVIYVHRITDPKVSGHLRRNFSMFKALCGPTAMKNVVIVTTKWDTGDEEAFKVREEQLKTKEEFFKQFIDDGAEMFRHYNTPSTAFAIIRRMLRNHPRALMIQQELDAGKDISQTGAGEELNRQVMEHLGQQREAIEKLQKEIRRERNEAIKRELEARQQEASASLDLCERGMREMSANYATAKEKFDKATRDLATHYQSQIALLLQHANPDHKVELKRLAEELDNTQNIPRSRIEEIGDVVQGLGALTVEEKVPL
jgi:tetratricopeptide (TPR) repeat protein